MAEATTQIKDVIIVAGDKKVDVSRLQHCLREEGYCSLACKTVKAIIEELNTLPILNIDISLVVIEPEILVNTDKDLVVELIERAADIPFILFDMADIVFSVKDWLPMSIQYLTVDGTRLIGHVFRSQRMKSFWSTEIEFLDSRFSVPEA